MTAESAGLLKLALAISDESRPDWSGAPAAPSGPPPPCPMIEQLRVLERIAGLHREPPDTGATAPPAGEPPLPERPAKPAAESTATLPPPPVPPEWVGGYRIIRKLGEGGMGVVYEAEQQQPRRPVALKIIRDAHLFSEDRIRMFRREAQSLALLKHPGIAAIYESGRSHQGIHYFAMELVRGQTLAEFIRARPPAISSRGELRLRLGIFRKICGAVNYAHQRGVIHRDLKPSNLFVLRESRPASSGSREEVLPEVKILDFGLARITDSDVAVTTFLTEAGRAMGTLPYMSPEQIQGNPDELDLRTDVYSLGVILYHLLAGQLPYRVTGANLLDAVRIIQQESPRSLPRSPGRDGRFDSDLETIVLKALAKEPALRYQSALALAEDLGRYLSGQPILAHPPSAIYLLRKLVRRHRLGFGAGVAGVVILAVLSVAMTVLAQRAARERDRANLEAASAREISEFLVSLFRVSNPLESRGKPVAARDLLANGAQRIRRDLKNQPLTQARLMDTIGTVYGTLGLDEEALSLLVEAKEIRARILGESSTEYARSLVNLTSLHRAGESVDEELSQVRRALAILERNLGPEDLEVADCVQTIGNMLWGKGDSRGALQAFQRARTIYEKRLRPDDLKLAHVTNNIGNAYLAAGDRKAAATWFERALRIKETLLGPDHPDVAFSLGNLGWVLVESGELERARPLVARSLEIIESVYGPTHTYTGIGYHNMGDLLRRMGRYVEARSYLERAIAIQETHSLKDLAECLHTLALVHAELGENGPAEERFKRSLSIREEVNGKDHPLVADTLADYAAFLKKVGQAAAASRIEDRVARLRALNSNAATTSP